jgi:hypothetical protein
MFGRLFIDTFVHRFQDIILVIITTGTAAAFVVVV